MYLKQSGKRMVPYFIIDDGKCHPGQYDVDELDLLHESIDDLTKQYSNKTYDNKESKTINGKLCDCYYNDDDTEVVYVYNDYVYHVHTNVTDTTFEYTWDAPEMSEFKLDRSKDSSCRSQDSRAYETPSEDFIHCPNSGSSSSAGSYKLVQPALPCAYVLTAERFLQGIRNVFDMKINGHYIYIKVMNDFFDTEVTLVRPDIINNTDKTVAVFNLDEDSCSLKYRDSKDMVLAIQELVSSFSTGFDKRTYNHKVSRSIDGKKCDCYYDDYIDEEAVYVCGKYISYIRSDELEVTFNFSWDAPEMREFKLDKDEYPECLDNDKRVFDTPSAEYSECTSPDDPTSPDSSARAHAVLSFVLAALTTSFVVLF